MRALAAVCRPTDARRLLPLKRAAPHEGFAQPWLPSHYLRLEPAVCTCEHYFGSRPTPRACSLASSNTQAGSSSTLPEDGLALLPSCA
ncbi:hypothetical protein GUJ93_ZPchr0010g9913 [Zizania palustris]|uniref:Uncharacterized protein n=1 Tax=Zizania palustris TaxID=103762 RepID=A0A8J5WEJ6_ZIZPA|nr:hypothetical protein GUJ93_ZPchr0010g9913 [Zizania palustris]